MMAVASSTSSSGHECVAWNAVMTGPLIEADSDEECECAFMNVTDGFEHVSSGAQSSRPELFDLAMHEDDSKVFKFGDHKGKTYVQVAKNYPDYLAQCISFHSSALPQGKLGRWGGLVC